MKKIQFFFVLMCVPMVYAVEIHEIYYDPIGTEAGGEAIVLYNPSDNNVDIGGWYLQTEASDRDALLPEPSVILSNGYYLIADAGWYEKKDSLNWPAADYEEPITLSNGDGGVALFDAAGDVVDKIGWGDVGGIESNLFMGSPAEDVDAGMSLLRKSRTGDNEDDFIPVVPVILSKLVPFVQNNTQTSLTLHIDVTSVDSMVSSFILSGSNVIDENKVLLTPGDTSYVEVSLTLSEPVEEVLFKGEQLSEEGGVFTANFGVGHMTPPGEYDVIVEIDGEDVAITYEVLPLLSIGLDTSDLSLSSRFGEQIIIEGDDDFSTLSKPTIQNMGNVPLEIGIESTLFTSSRDVLEEGVVSFRLGNSTTFSPLSFHDGSITSTALAVNQRVGLGLKINLEDAEDGLYEGSILLKARAAK